MTPELERAAKAVDLFDTICNVHDASVSAYDRRVRAMAKVIESLSAQSAQPQAGEPVATPQHVAYFDDGQFHWMSGIAPRNCELYASPQPANPEQVTDAIRSIVEDALNSAIPEPWEVAEHATQRILTAIGAGVQVVPEGRWIYTSACPKYEGHTNRVRAYAGSIHAGWENSPEFESAEAFYEWAKAECRWRNAYEAKCRAALSHPHPADERVVEAPPRPDAVSMTCGTICLEYADKDDRDLAFDWLESHGAGAAQEGRKNG